jgi:hypothetical protein
MNLNLSFIPHTRLGATRDHDRELIACFGGKYGSRRPERCTNQKKRRAIIHEPSAKPIAPCANSRARGAITFARDAIRIALSSIAFTRGAITCAPGANGFAPRKTVIEHRTKHAEHRILPNKHGYF